MFTGIIQSIGRICTLESRCGDVRLCVETTGFSLQQVKLGDSISVNGVCLTAVDFDAACFSADVSRESLSRTMLQDLGVGSQVNLEKALTLSTPIGGHFVSGHVDGVATVKTKKPDGRSVRLQIEAPDNLAKYIAEKGSICVNGVSLTVNKVDGSTFDVNIVPHTLTVTTLGATLPGQRLNLEVDLLARYIERLMLGEHAAIPNSSVSRENLQSAGFL